MKGKGVAKRQEDGYRVKFWRRASTEEMGNLGSSCRCDNGPLGRQVRAGDLGWFTVCHTVLHFEYFKKKTTEF